VGGTLILCAGSTGFKSLLGDWLPWLGGFLSFFVLPGEIWSLQLVFPFHFVSY